MAGRRKFSGFDAKSGDHVGGGSLARENLSVDEQVADWVQCAHSKNLWHLRAGYLVVTNRRLIYTPNHPPLLGKEGATSIDRDRITELYWESRRRWFFLDSLTNPALVVRTVEEEEHTFWPALNADEREAFEETIRTGRRPVAAGS
jgi:hypothetical protein